LRFIHVATYAHDRGELLQLVQNRKSNQITRVNDEVSPTKDSDATRREPASATRHVRISEDRDHELD